jgi:hypothetical protein
MEHVDANGKVTPVPDPGYSGEGTGKNNPSAQNVSNKDNPGNSGPIPQGGYTIGPVHNGVSERGSKLKNEMSLTPDAGTDTFGRNDFAIHGDNRANPGHASWGCVILSPRDRAIIGASPDRQLEVVP